MLFRETEKLLFQIPGCIILSIYIFPLKLNLDQSSWNKEKVYVSVLGGFILPVNFPVKFSSCPGMGINIYLALKPIWILMEIGLGLWDWYKLSTGNNFYFDEMATKNFFSKWSYSNLTIQNMVLFSEFLTNQIFICLIW